MSRLVTFSKTSNCMPNSMAFIMPYENNAQHKWVDRDIAAIVSEEAACWNVKADSIVVGHLDDNEAWRSMSSQHVINKIRHSFKSTPTQYCITCPYTLAGAELYVDIDGAILHTPINLTHFLVSDRPRSAFVTFAHMWACEAAPMPGFSISTKVNCRVNGQSIDLCAHESAESLKSLHALLRPLTSDDVVRVTVTLELEQHNVRAYSKATTVNVSQMLSACVEKQRADAITNVKTLETAVHNINACTLLMAKCVALCKHERFAEAYPKARRECHRILFHGLPVVQLTTSKLGTLTGADVYTCGGLAKTCAGPVEMLRRNVNRLRALLLERRVGPVWHVLRAIFNHFDCLLSGCVMTASMTFGNCADFLCINESIAAHFALEPMRVVFCNAAYKQTPHFPGSRGDPFSFLLQNLPTFSDQKKLLAALMKANATKGRVMQLRAQGCFDKFDKKTFKKFVDMHDCVDGVFVSGFLFHMQSEVVVTLPVGTIMLVVAQQERFFLHGSDGNLHAVHATALPTHTLRVGLRPTFDENKLALNDAWRAPIPKHLHNMLTQEIIFKKPKRGLTRRNATSNLMQ